MRGLLAISVLWTSGCDQLWKLEHVDPPPDAPACPDSYAPLAGMTSKYRYVGTWRLWDEAAADCANDSAGTTHLVVPDDMAEIVAIRTLVTDGMTYTVHVGYARDTAAAGGDPRVFYAVTGETLDLNAPGWELWNPNEPNNQGGIETIVFIEHDKTLMDGEPFREQRYVCECDGRVPARQFTLR